MPRPGDGSVFGHPFVIPVGFENLGSHSDACVVQIVIPGLTRNPGCLLDSAFATRYSAASARRRLAGIRKRVIFGLLGDREPWGLVRFRCVVISVFDNFKKTFPGSPLRARSYMADSAVFPKTKDSNWGA